MGPEPKDEHERKALLDVETFGCHVIHVLEDDVGPGFSYSVGIQRASSAPEVVVIGLKQALGHSVVNEYNRRVRKRERFEPGARYDGFIGGFEVQAEIVDRAHYREYFGWNLWLYSGPEFEVIQLIYPTTDGIWPWEAGASDWFRNNQPLLQKAR